MRRTTKSARHAQPVATSENRRVIDVALRREIGAFTLDVAFANAGGVTALFGPSGSGKSMTIGLIAGLERPTRGRVEVDGDVLVDTERRIHVPVHRRRVGLVFQDSHLFPHLSVRQNLAFGRWFAPRGARRVETDAVVETLGIGPLLSRRPATLSGGERQRVAIGRAVLACPLLLLLDEPLAALDRKRRLEILPLIERLRDELAIPIVYVSHAMEEVVRLAGHVVVLEHGRVAARGDPVAVFGPRRRTDEPRFGRKAVIEAQLGAIDEAYGLTALEHPAGRLWLADRAGPPGRYVRVLVDATDVSLASGEVGHLSIRSALAGTIAGLEPDGALVAVEVALDGAGALLALVTRRALDDLALGVGSRVKALVKTVALDEGAVSPGA